MKTLMVLFLCLVVSFSFALSKAQSQTQLTAEIDRIIGSEFKAQDSGGVVLIGQHGNVIYKRAFGMANLELNVPMKEEMVFNVGSITKQFTAIAILQLMEQGKLSLQDEITKYLSDYPVNGQKITSLLLSNKRGVSSSVLTRTEKQIPTRK